MSACDDCLSRAALTSVSAQPIRRPPRAHGLFTPDALPPAEPLMAGLSPERARRAKAQLRGWTAAWARVTAAAAQVELVCRHDDRYPPVLLELEQPPEVLHARGDLELLSRFSETLGIVGARRPTLVGREAARDLAHGVAQLGGVVLSGMALGIDAAAHDGALNAGGPTIAILGGGAERASPMSNARLYARILERGLVLSELPPGTRPQRWTFPARNRLIAALSRAVLVVEAGVTSGSLITVDHAAELGRDIGAMPGSVANPMAAATNNLLRDGATLVCDASDAAGLAGIVPPAERVALPDLPAEQLAVFALLASVPRTVSELSEELERAAPGSGAALTLTLVELELAGVVGRGSDGRYRLRGPWAAQRAAVR